MTDKDFNFESKIPNSKIALGTVQFGLKYGINNKSGVVEDEELYELLNCAYLIGVDTLDTAYNYGNSEKKIGNFISSFNRKFKIISKAPKGSNSITIKKYFQESLDNLNSDSLFGYMIHDFNDYLNDKKIFNSLSELRKSGLVKKIGFSIYYPEQLEILFTDEVNFDLIQLPYSLADRRFEKYFKLLKNRNVEIHIRSIFLQGLFFMKPEELPEKLKPFTEFNMKIDKISTESNRTIENIAINFVSQNNNIDKIVIGVDNKDQLQNNLKEINNRIETKALLNIKEELTEINIPKELLIPSNWN